MYRTHTCGELRSEDVGQTVTLCGWVDSTRDHGKGLFIDLRDRYGVTQAVVLPDRGDELLAQSKQIRNEFVLKLVGTVHRRPEGQENPRQLSGDIDVHVNELEVLNRCEVPPFLPSQLEMPGEDLRLKYRYLDLRRKGMQQTLELRSNIIKTMRDYFEEDQFIDVETRILGRSTPEGARDYLVPSRVHPGSFYALPQSPQLYKQIMMVAGYDRYVQIARCFRDEDLRADRQPEFTQLDMEMSFVDSDDIIGMIDGLMARLMKQLRGVDLPLPLPRMTYDEAMRRYGHDAPDLRYGMEIEDCTDLAAEAEFRVFRSVAESGNFVRGINAKQAADNYSRKGIDELTEFVQHDFGAKGLAWFKVDADGKLASPIAKNFPDALLARFKERMGGEPGDLLLLIADSWETSCRALNGLRRRLANELKLYNPEDMHFSWVVEFPMFEHDEESKRWVAMHHPFTSPRDEDLSQLSEAPNRCRAKAYDLVVNGYEAGGGTIRIHNQAVQQEVFGLLGMTPQEAQERFGFLLDALKYGAPPHGGIALGIDRVVMLFGGLDNIRDCIAFPKTQRAMDLMTEAPNTVAKEQLKELGLNLAQPPAQRGPQA